MPIASGSFTVTPTSRAEYDPVVGAAALGRTTFAKVFEGDMAGTGRVEMLSCMGLVEGSAGYVAIERITCTLGGREGSFVMQHSGTMHRGTPSLSVTVVPDSATGALQGLSGSLIIDIVEKKHFYKFDYLFADSLD